MRCSGSDTPPWAAAIREQLELGFAPTLLSDVEIELAEDMVGMIPCAEQVAFGKNGSDVLALAARIARAYTRRDKVLFCGYHGVQDWYMAADPECPRILAGRRALILPFCYNDLDSPVERHGAVLVFDEVITGLRLAPGGAQEHFGVRPHLGASRSAWRTASRSGPVLI